VSVEHAKAQSAEAVQILDSNRICILEFIKANPGTHLRKIKRELNLATAFMNTESDR
jgi:predicted transcriptional regulator